MTNYKNVTNCSRYAIKIDGCKCIPNIVAYGMQCTFCYKYKEKLVRFKWILWDVENPTNEELENVIWHAKSLFNNKEREKNMITDEQGREWLLQKLYDDGWKYYVKTAGELVFLTTKEPVVIDNILDIISGGHTKCVESLKKIMPDIDKCGILNIGEELGIIDWSKVPVDTPIYVREHENNTWEKRHFAFFKNGRVYSWLSGVTSWTAEDTNYVFSWKYAKLAELAEV